MTSKIATKTKQIFGKKPTWHRNQTTNPVTNANFVGDFKKKRKDNKTED